MSFLLNRITIHNLKDDVMVSNLFLHFVTPTLLANTRYITLHINNVIMIHLVKHLYSNHSWAKKSLAVIERERERERERE